MMIRPRYGILTLPSLLVATALVATTAAAQGAPGDDVDERWLPWLGCWQLVEETGVLDDGDDPDRFADQVMVCVTPTENDGRVTVTTGADSGSILVETLTADGIQHPVDEEACSGWRQNSWSSDGARLFTRAELTCDDAGRTVSGVGLLADARTWLDLQLVDTGDRGAVTVRRYRRARPADVADAGAEPLPDALRERVLTAARLTATSPLSLDDVIEASLAVEPAVVETMLVETGTSFALDGRALVRLDDGGVPEQVIDLMVALSYPDAFTLERPPGGVAGGGFASPYGFSQWYPYYASPFGYYYGWSPYDSLYYLGPAASYAVVPETVDPGAGRVYSGRGYTRIDRRELPSGRQARQRGEGDGGSSGTSSGGGANSGGSQGGGGGRATPSGFTRDTPSERSAQPRR